MPERVEMGKFEPTEDESGRQVKQECCEAWAKAHEWETDNEGYRALVYYLNLDDPSDDRARIGLKLPAVRFCPWCGSKKD